MSTQAHSPLTSDDDGILPIVPSPHCVADNYGSTSKPDDHLTLSSAIPQTSTPSIQLDPISPSSGTSFVSESPMTPQDPHFLRALNLPSPNSSMTSSPAHAISALPQHASNDPHATSNPHLNLERLLASASMESTGFEEGIYGHILDHILQVEQAKAAAACVCDHTIYARGTCGCIENAMVYNSLLELSVRLRKAVESLGKVPDHAAQGFGSRCHLYERIRELDKLTS